MRILTIATGLVAALAAVYTLSAMAGEPPAAEVEETVMPAVSVVDQMADELALEAGIRQVGYELPALPDPEVAALDPAVSAVLANAGYTQFTPTYELTDTLSPDVLKLLIAKEAVLIIASTDGGGQG